MAAIKDSLMKEILTMPDDKLEDLVAGYIQKHHYITSRRMAGDLLHELYQLNTTLYGYDKIHKHLKNRIRWILKFLNEIGNLVVVDRNNQRILYKKKEV